MVQMDDDVLHVVARRLVDDSARLNDLSDDLMPSPTARADHVGNPLPARSQPPPTRGHPRNARIIPKSRDFH